MRLSKVFTFDSAHFLPRYHGGCEKLHGHTYRLIITVRGTPDSDGMVVDFSVLKSAVEQNVLKKLDHSLINDLITQPTVENIGIWIWKALHQELEKTSAILDELELWETPTSYVRMTVEDIQEKNLHE